MQLTNSQLSYFVDNALKLPPGKRKHYLEQVDFLIMRLEGKIKSDTSFKVKGFKKTGSLMKGTVLRPRDGCGVDADVAVFLDISESSKQDIQLLHTIIRKLTKGIYPQKKDSDFTVQPRTLGIEYHDSGLDVDLVPIIPVPSQPSYGWQPSAQNGEPIKTSVEGQLAFIKNRHEADPLFRSLVRLLKKWRNVQELTFFRSFTIELILAYLQDTHGPALDLENGIERFFLFIAQTALQQPIKFRENGSVQKLTDSPVIVLDPVNSENNVAARITDSERKEIVRNCEDAWERVSTATCINGKGDTVDLWKEVFGRSFVIEE